MRGKNSILICLAIALLSAPMVVNISFAPTLPEMSVSPETTVSASGQYFTVQIYLKDAVEVSAWEFKITWDLDMTEFPPTTTEGTFFSPYPTYFQAAPNILYKNVLAGCFMTEPGSKTGSGVLASITFKIREDNSGTSVLHLYDTKLWDPDGIPIVHTVKDGLFYTTNPKVIFSWTPEAPLPEEVVTFDGTASYDPDGGDIIYYEWDFGDGSDPEAGAVVTHTYADYQFDPYQVTLTVVDDDYEIWYLTRPLRIWRDVGIVSVWSSMDEWDNTHLDAYACDIDPYMGVPGLCWILVTCVNFGTITETYEIHLYADADTSVIGDEVEVFAFTNEFTQAPNTGSDFNLIFIWDVSYGASTGEEVFGVPLNDPVDPGQYTFTAIIYFDGDQDATNDMMQSPFGLHAPVEVTRIVRASAGKTDHVYKMKHGPITFGGFIQNFDNIYAVMRPPWDQGEWGRLAFDIIDESGDTVAHLTSEAVYLNYLEECPDQLTATWSDLAVGNYIGVAYAEFGINGATFPYWGENTIEFSFAIIP